MIKMSVTVEIKGKAQTFQLEAGESKGGNYTTFTPAKGNKVIPFGKLYVANEVK